MCLGACLCIHYLLDRITAIGSLSKRFFNSCLSVYLYRPLFDLVPLWIKTSVSVHILVRILLFSGQLELHISSILKCQRSSHFNTNLQNKHIEWDIICSASLSMCSITGKTVRPLRWLVGILRSFLLHGHTGRDRRGILGEKTKTPRVRELRWTRLLWWPQRHRLLWWPQRHQFGCHLWSCPRMQLDSLWHFYRTGRKNSLNGSKVKGLHIAPKADFNPGALNRGTICGRWVYYVWISAILRVNVSFSSLLEIIAIFTLAVTTSSLFSLCCLDFV
jgi:hypothetical protein